MLYFAYALSAAALWMQILFYPTFPILPFAPFIAISLLSRPFSRALLLACIAGISIDLLSNDPLGINGLSYTLAAAALYRIRNLFSVTHPIQLSFYTAIVSLIITALQIGLLFLFDRRVPFCGKWWLTDWAMLPVADAIFALVWFAGPLALFSYVHKTWVVYWLKKNNPSPT